MHARVHGFQLPIRGTINYETTNVSSPPAKVAGTYIRTPEQKTKSLSPFHGISIYVQPRCGSCELATSAGATIPLPCRPQTNRLPKRNEPVTLKPRVRTYEESAPQIPPKNIPVCRVAAYLRVRCHADLFEHGGGRSAYLYVAQPHRL